MKTKVKNLMLALVAVLACVSISSCSKEEDPNMGIGNYYFQLTNVESNCLDENGKNIADALKSAWISANNADAQGKMLIGKTDKESACARFTQNVDAQVKAHDDAYRGKNLLPKNGYIRLFFSLGSDASYGGANESSTIEVTNSGARRI